MSLSTTLDHFSKTALRAHGERVYAEARSRHPALAPYETVGAVLAASARGSGVSVAERDALFAALVTELQRTPDPLWPSLLMVTFTPMLVRLRSVLGTRGCEDLDACVLVAFIEVARGLSFRTYVARNLWLLTRSRLFAERRRERRAPDLCVFDEETHPCDPFGVQAYERAAAAEVVRIIEAEGGEELREVLLATCGDDSTVSEYVERAYAAQDEHVRARIAKRLRRARLEAFARLRARAERREHLRAPAA